MLKKTLQALPILIGVFQFVVLNSCKQDEPEPSIVKPETEKVGISSVTPTKAVHYQLITIVANNVGEKLFSSLKIGNETVVPESVVDSIIVARVPYMSGGKKTIEVEFSGEKFVMPNAIEYLPFEFTALADSIIKSHPSGVIDSLSIIGKNIPHLNSAFGVKIGRYVNGVYQDELSSDFYFTSAVLKENGVSFGFRYDPNYAANEELRYFLKYMDKEFELPSLAFRGFYRLDKNSVAGVPEQEILLNNGNRSFSRLGVDGFESQVYLGGVKLKQYYSWPTDIDSEGYQDEESFGLPMGLAPGEYELEVYELDGTTPILPDSAYKITISDITFCPEKSVYNRGEDIKFNVYPYMYPHRCYSCPKTIEILSKGGLGDSVGEVKKIDSVGKDFTYFVMAQPLDITAGTYSFTISSPGGYVYKIADGCENTNVEIIDP